MIHPSAAPARRPNTAIWAAIRGALEIAALSAAIAALTVAISLWTAHALGHSLGLGPLSQHMVDHIALLVVAAPIAAWMLRHKLPATSPGGLVLIVALHIGLIWAWHLPPVLDAAHTGHALHIAMCVSLFAIGVFFWHAIIGLGRDRWQAIVALLLTGKLFCLFAALLVFSPRLLYAGLAHSHHAAHGTMTGIADQQMAGLIMLAICPLAYVATGIVIAARWILDIERESPEPPLWVRASPKSSLLALPLLLLLGGCSEIQSVMAPASPEAERILHLTWILFLGGTAIFLFVLVALALAMTGGSAVRRQIGGIRIVTAGGIALPIVVLTALLAYGVWLARADAATGGDLQDVTVQGEQWWWRVTYHDPDATRLASANEIRLEAGRPVRLRLTSQDVIHSFWVPSLAGKVDAIPGRTTEIRFTPQTPGTYRGQCAEYCGGPHALMALRVVVMSPDDYAQWIEGERQPADAPADDTAKLGQELFLSSCIACHAVRGTDARGQLGPDLTHVGNRATLGGEVLPMSKENIARWITDNQSLKPNNLMPEFRTYSAEELDALASYIAGLR